MSFTLNRFGLACVCVALLCGTATLAHAADYTITWDPDEDYPAGALSPGANLATVSSVYTPAFGISIGEYPNGWDISHLGECCGGERFLNIGSAPEGRLHWFVNAAPGKYFPAGSTISVDWASSGGPAALKAYGGSIVPGEATITNANDGTAFGGKIGSVISPPEQFVTLSLVLTADARSFTVHQSSIVPPFTDDTYVTGTFEGEPLAPNAAINGIRLTVVPEPATVASLAVVGVLLPLVARRRLRA